MFSSDQFVGTTPLEIVKAEMGSDGASEGNYLQILIGPEQVMLPLDETVLRVLEDFCATLYSYGTATTLALDLDDVDANLGERSYFEKGLGLGFEVEGFGVNLLQLVFYTFDGDQSVDLATISITGDELKSNVSHVMNSFGVDADWCSLDDAAPFQLTDDPFTDAEMVPKSWNLNYTRRQGPAAPS